MAPIGLLQPLCCHALDECPLCQDKENQERRDHESAGRHEEVPRRLAGLGLVQLKAEGEGELIAESNPAPLVVKFSR